MRRPAIAIVLALAAIGTAAPPANADPYVALGDSVAAGSGASSPDNRYVNRLFGAYQAGFGADQLVNRAEGGATSSSLRNNGQLATALADLNAANDAKAVTIDIGGNDYLTGQCTATEWDDPAGCPFRANLESILSQLQDALEADPGSEPLIVMAYYNPGVGTANEASFDRGLLGANLAVRCADTGADVGLNDVIYQEAGRLGLAVADAYTPFKASGQALMAPDFTHPNDAGHAAIAQAFREATVPQACSDPTPPDTTPPETRITKAPANELELAKARYRFRSSEEGSTFECRLDRTGWAACGSPKRLRNLDPGRHRFRVRATDPAGNTDRTPAVDRFKVLD